MRELRNLLVKKEVVIKVQKEVIRKLYGKAENYERNYDLMRKVISEMRKVIDDNDLQMPVVEEENLRSIEETEGLETLKVACLVLSFGIGGYGKCRAYALRSIDWRWKEYLRVGRGTCCRAKSHF